MSQALGGQPPVHLGGQILLVFGQGGGAPPVIVPPVVQAPLPAAPPQAFLQANALLPTLDDPVGILPADHNLLHGLRQTAEQLVAANDYVNAPPAVATLQTAWTRVTAAIAVQGLARATAQSLDTAIAKVPQPVRDAGGYADEHPISDRLRAAANAANVRTAATNFPALTVEIQACAAVITTFDGLVTSLAGQFGRITRMYAQFSGPLATIDKQLKTLSKRLYTHKSATLEWDQFCALAERTVTPTNKDMQKLRASNADDAMRMVGKLIDAGLIGIGDHEAFYESPFDKALDHFGASWGLKSLGASGALQWLDTWEFHIHGEAVRNGGNAITTFKILVGHIKPTSQQRAVGASISVTDATMLAAVIAATQAKFLRWATSKDGEQTLSRKKRSS